MEQNSQNSEQQHQGLAATSNVGFGADSDFQLAKIVNYANT
jgi:hypothetical protein